MIRINRDRKHIVVSVLGLKIKFKKKYKLKPLLEKGITNKKRDTKIIISLTSFPARINVVNKAIHTLLQQSIKPDEVILWLAEEQFPNKEADLTSDLLALQEFGLSIKWCNDIKSYKKLIPTLKEYPKDIIVTVDDDIYYENDFLEKLYNAYLEDPNYIYTHRIKRIQFDNDKLYIEEFKKYDEKLYTETRALDLLTGCGGVLYPANSLYKDILKESIFMDICNSNDDIWFWAMGILQGYESKLIKDPYFKPNIIESSQKESLCAINNPGEDNSKFMIQLNNVISFYPKLGNIIKDKD
jgi:hypothetical protein